MTRAPLLAEAATARVVHEIKREAHTLVQVWDHAGHRIVTKIYRQPRWLLWRTFLLRSRALREFRNLEAAIAAGIRCVRPVAWDEERRGGIVFRSALATEYEADAPALKQVLATAPGPARRALAVACGRFVRAMHAQGLLGNRITPRNFLVVGAPAQAELVLLDLPAMLLYGRSLLGTRTATLDVYDAAFSPNRRRQWSRPERLRLVAAYCGGDRHAARTLWRRLARRPGWWNRLHKALRTCWRGYLLAR